MAESSQRLTAGDVEAVGFATVIRGYHIVEVDDFLARIAAALNSYERGREPDTLSSRDVEAVTFRTKLRGYDLDQVDDFLDEVTRALRHYESAGRSKPAVPTRVDVDGPSEVADIDETPPSRHPPTKQTTSSEDLLRQAKKWMNRS